MSEICEKCGLPKEICVCGELAKRKQKILIKTVERRFGKKMTVIQGLTKDVDIKMLTKNLKQKLACGGTYKEGVIELQGNHVQKVKEELMKLGFHEDTIETK